MTKQERLAVWTEQQTKLIELLGKVVTEWSDEKQSDLDQDPLQVENERRYAYIRWAVPQLLAQRGRTSGDIQEAIRVASNVWDQVKSLC